jgi:rod shape-determining protein MreD
VTRTRWGLASLVVVTVVVVQVAVFDAVLPLGIRVDLPLLLVLGVALSARRADAAVLGWATGLLVDLHQLTPLALTALVYAVAAWSLADSRRRVVEAGVGFRTAQGALAAMGVGVVLWVGAALLGHGPGRGGWDLVGWSLGLALSGAVGVHPATAVGHRLQRGHQLTSGSPLPRTRPV